MNKIAPLIQKMIKYNHGNAKKRISHALKVHNYAKTIAILEKVNEYDLFNLESAAILHDIGIKVCEKKYNSTEGKLQEKRRAYSCKRNIEKSWIIKTSIGYCF